MPTFYQSDVILKKKPAKLEAGPCVVQQRMLFPVRADLADNDIIEALVLPADHTIVDAVIDSDDLDAHNTPALAYNVGIMSGVVGLSGVNGVAGLARTVGAELFSGAITGQAVGAVRPTLRTAFSILPATVDRSIGIQITEPPATQATRAAAGKFLRNVGFWQPGTVYAVGDWFYLADGRRVFVDTGHGGTSGTTQPLEKFGAAVYGGTIANDGTVTWTMGDLYIALAISYRSVS
jgi:hypothetical protein